MSATRPRASAEALAVTVAQFVVAFVCAGEEYTATLDAGAPAPWWPCAGVWLRRDAVHLAYRPEHHDSVKLLLRAAGARVVDADDAPDLARSRAWAGDTMPGHDEHGWPAAAVASVVECLPPAGVVRTLAYRRRGVPARFLAAVAHLNALHGPRVGAAWVRLPTKANPSRVGLQIRGDGWRLTLAVQGRDDFERPAVAVDPARPWVAVCEHCGTSGHRAPSFVEMIDAATAAGWDVRDASDGAALLTCPTCGGTPR